MLLFVGVDEVDFCFETFVMIFTHFHNAAKHTFAYSLGTIYRGGAAYLYLISILIWPHFDTYPYISIQNILMRAQNILITPIYLSGGSLPHLP